MSFSSRNLEIRKTIGRVVAVYCLLQMLLFVASAIDNYDVLNIMDAAKAEIDALRELIESSSEIELQSEREALIAAENLFSEGKRKFGYGNLEEAYSHFNKALEMSLASQKSVLEKLYSYNLNITRELIAKAERAGISTEPYVESIESAMKSKKELEGSNTKDEVRKLKAIVSFLVNTREDLAERLEDIQKRAQDRIADAEAKMEETKMYFFLNSNSSAKFLERARSLFDKGQYLKAESYASKSIEISERIIRFGQAIYTLLVTLISFTLWILYERRKPENRRSVLYRKIFSRGGGMNVW